MKGASLFHCHAGRWWAQAMWRRIHSVMPGVEHGIVGVNAMRRCWPVSPGPTGPLWIPGLSERNAVLAVAEAEEADLVAFEELFDDDVLLRVSPSQLAAQPSSRAASTAVFGA